MSSRRMPKAIEILDRWVNELVDKKYWLDCYFIAENKADLNECTHICFACGTMSGTHRAHILPKNKGGEDSVNNIHLLCPECHMESEDLCGKTYWDWFHQKGPNNSGSLRRLLNKAVFFSQMIEKGNIDCIPGAVKSDLIKFGVIPNNPK